MIVFFCLLLPILMIFLYKNFIFNYILVDDFINILYANWWLSIENDCEIVDPELIYWNRCLYLFQMFSLTKEISNTVRDFGVVALYVRVLFKSVSTQQHWRCVFVLILMCHQIVFGFKLFTVSDLETLTLLIIFKIIEIPNFAILFLQLLQTGFKITETLMSPYDSNLVLNNWKYFIAISHRKMQFYVYIYFFFMFHSCIWNYSVFASLVWYIFYAKL